jgi:hypothetical protein
MPSPSPGAVAVHLVLRGRPPAPARLTLAYRRARWRMPAAVGVLGAFAAATAWLARVTPSGPWSTLVLAAGLVLAARAWRDRYRVASFMGLCPACGCQMALRTGGRIRLPRRIFCNACGSSPELCVRAPRPAASPCATPGSLRHYRADCTGQWRAEWLWDESFLSCRECGVRHPASSELRRAAAEENQRGDLLARLADEGRFL